MNEQQHEHIVNPYGEGPLADAWLLGFNEGDGDIGMTYDNDPASPRSVAYDEGRTARRGDVTEGL